MTLCVVCCVSFTLFSVRAAVSQDEPAVKSVLDSRYRPLIGVWEGRRPSNAREERQEHILVISENAGQLEARHGHSERSLKRVDISVDLVESLVRVSFRTDAGHNVTLYLMQDDLLSGVFVVSAGRGGKSPERKLILERRK